MRTMKSKKNYSMTINLSTVESEISVQLEKIQNSFKNVEIGSYPYFKAGKIGVSLVLRSTEIKNINKCSKIIIEFLNKKNIYFVNNQII